MELVMAPTPCEQLQRTLLEQPKGFTIDKILLEGRKYEALAAGRKSLQTMDIDRSVGAITHYKKGQHSCGNCGTKHPPRRCPAYKDTCHSCGKVGHWVKMCRQAQKRGRSPKRQTHGKRSSSNQWRNRRSKSRNNRKDPVDEITAHGGSFDDTHHEATAETQRFDVIDVSKPQVTYNTARTEAFVEVDIVCPQKAGQHILKLKVDTGASGNTLPLRIVKNMYGNRWRPVHQDTQTRLTAYNGSQINCVGTIDLMWRYKSTDWNTQTFYVVDVPAILGLPGCHGMAIVMIHELQCHTPSRVIRNVDDLKAAYPAQFDRIGNFRGTASLHLEHDAQPSIDPPWKCSVHLRDKIKTELQTMEQNGVIRKIEHHTDWCSSMTTTVRKDGSIRLCLDPRRLNNALKRPHKVPTLEEVNLTFAGARYFSKLDAKSGYWSIHLAAKSQELTTFRTLFGRYCFQRLPFGLCVSQDIFQQHMDRIIDGIPGCICIAGDVVVVGRTEEEHDKNLWLLMEKAQQEGLVFNSGKCSIKKDRISFFGLLYTRSGIRLDPMKVEMQTPKDKEDVQRCLGLFTYLAAYIPNFSEKAVPLRELLRMDTPFLWEIKHGHTFEALKDAITEDICLRYYDPRKETTLEVDASMKGVGACLLQNAEPVEYSHPRAYLQRSRIILKSSERHSHWSSESADSIRSSLERNSRLRQTTNHLKRSGESQ
ncbi:uncharacterized protein [Diadema setosum]|uniref:uncharacterized protein n=1 Tax=Diadema setosum TaxID=31175 RepID=UPI003B39FF4D